MNETTYVTGGPGRDGSDMKWINEWVGDLDEDQEKTLDDHIKLNPFPWDL